MSLVQLDEARAMPGVAAGTDAEGVADSLRHRRLLLARDEAGASHRRVSSQILSE